MGKRVVFTYGTTGLGGAERERLLIVERLREFGYFPVVAFPATRCSNKNYGTDILKHSSPGSPDELAKAMTQVLTEEPLQQDLRARGLARVKDMTWQAAAVRTLALYQELCASRG